MALPNMLGLLLLSGKVKLKLDDYWQAYKLGDFDLDRETDEPRVRVVSDDE